jgi:hypothetical protein
MKNKGEIWSTITLSISIGIWIQYWKNVGMWHMFTVWMQSFISYDAWLKFITAMSLCQDII